MSTIHLIAARVRLGAASLNKVLKSKLTDEEGIGVIEIILILLVLVGLVIIFKDKIISLANNIFSNINTQAGGV